MVLKEKSLEPPRLGMSMCLMVGREGIENFYKVIL